MNVLVVTVFCVAILLALLTNRDLFSPAKFYLFSFALFYTGALFEDQPLELWFLVLAVLVVGIGTMLAETVHTGAGRVRAARPPPILAGGRFFAAWMWVLTLPAILAQFYLIVRFGGIEGYVNIIGNRVVELRGFGWAKTLMSTITVFNLVYFAVGLTRPRRRTWWLLYVVHTLVLVFIGLLSGSRGGILNIFAMQLICYHYIRRPVTLKSAVPVAAALIVAAMVLGVARQGIKYDDDEIQTGIRDTSEVFKLSIFDYGVIPLEIIVETNQLRLAYGSTLVSLVTNVVPRDWWPDKPDTGGVFLTKEYIGESIINFGWILGTVFFLATYQWMMLMVVGRYRRRALHARGTRSPAVALDIVAYVCIMWAVVGLMAGEVTNVLLNLALTQLVPIAGVRILLTRRGTAPPPRDDPQPAHAAAA
jgi:hypothetical protein